MARSKDSVRQEQEDRMYEEEEKSLLASKEDLDGASAGKNVIEDDATEGAPEGAIHSVLSEADEAELAMIEEEAVMTVAQSILTTRNEAVEWRAMSGVELWWRISEELLDYTTDLPAYSTMMDYVSGNAPIKQTGEVARSKAVMNIIRGRCEVAQGRIEDILFPVFAKNYGFKVTPRAEVASMRGDMSPAVGPKGEPIEFTDGQPAALNDVYNELMARATESMAKMEQIVDDQLTECQYNEEARKVISRAVRMGTGIIKGPCASKKLRRIWNPTKDKKDKLVHILEYKQDNRPISKEVDPWNLYPSPDCGDDPQKAAYFWEKDTMRVADVQRMIGQPGYSARQLELVLGEQPKRLNVAQDQHANAFKVRVENAQRGELYEVWEYNGNVRPDFLEILNCKCTGDKPVSARVIFINDHPVKADLNLLDTGDNLYDFFPWSPIDGLPWGAGEPMKMAWAQRIINAAWRQMLDNAGDSSGSNVAIKGIEPADGIWELTGKKLWKWDGDTDFDDIRKAITSFQTTNNQADLQAMLELALRFVDLMTATPTIFQGEMQETPETLGATNIVVDSSNITYRSKVKLWDDRITVPHLRRYYDYNMQYHPDHKAKGDFDVDPRGASILFEKDQMRQMLLTVWQMKTDPDILRRTDWDKAVEQLYASAHLDILKPKEEEGGGQPQAPADPAQAAKQQQQQAMIEVANIRAKTEMDKATLVQNATMEELKFKAQQAELERAHDLKMKEYDLQIKMMEYSEKSKIELSKLKVQLAISAEGMNLQQNLSEKSAAQADELDARDKVHSDIQGDKQAANEDRKMDKQAEQQERQFVAKQVATPPTEPAGRAPAGQAYPR